MECCHACRQDRREAVHEETLMRALFKASQLNATLMYGLVHKSSSTDAVARLLL